MSIGERVFRPLHGALRGHPILFHGIKRSGNHLVLNWIQSGDHFRFRNNVLPFLHIYPRGELDAQVHSLRYPALTRIRFYNWLWRPRCIASVEDQTITRWLFTDPEPSDLQNVLLVRCPINLFASQIKRGFSITHEGYPRTFNEIMKRSRRLWIEHAREAAGETSFLKNKVVVVYDQFIVDAEHRARIAAQLRITPDDRTLEQQAPEGRGSSFHHGKPARREPDSTDALRNRAQLLNAEERALLDQVLNEPELHRLRAKLLAFEAGV